MQELIADGGTGFHFTPGDPKDLANKAEHSWTNPADLDAMRKQARRTYEVTYTAAHNYAMLFETYERAIRNHRARHEGLAIDRPSSAWGFESQPEQTYRVSGYRPKASYWTAPRNRDL